VMKRHFAEIEDGRVVAIHAATVRGNAGDNARIPQVPVSKRRPENTLTVSTSANVGDVMRGGKLYRKLERRP